MYSGSTVKSLNVALLHTGTVTPLLLDGRIWAKIGHGITRLQGTDVTVEKPPQRMEQQETIEQYLARHPAETVTIHSSISTHSSRQKTANSECHRSHRLNLAKVSPNHLIHILQLNHGFSAQK